MDLKALTEKGAFVPAELVPVQVTWEKSGGDDAEVYEFTIHVKRLSYGVVERILLQSTADRSSTAAMISEAVRLGEKGDQIIPYEQAFQLEPSLARAFVDAVKEVNNLKDGAAEKKSEPPTSSGTS